MSDWIERQVDGFKRLCGRTVTAWSGEEMAVREVGSDGLPEWYDPCVPALQLTRLDLLLPGGQVVSVVTYQNDARWGLYRRDDLPALDFNPPPPDSIFRDRSLTEIPVGEIDAVDVAFDELGDIAKVRLRIEGHDVLLRAGEVWEQPDGSLRVVEMDESILVQVDGRMPGADPAVHPPA